MSTNPPANADEHAVEEAMAGITGTTAWPMLLGVVLAAFGIIADGFFMHPGDSAAIALVGWMQRLLVVEARSCVCHEGTKMNGGMSPFLATF